MENIIADYNRLNLINFDPWKSNFYYKKGVIVVPSVNNGYFYKCTSPGTGGRPNPHGPSAGHSLDWY